MSVRAKFKVLRTIKTEAGTEIMMEPVTSGSEENKLFFKYTPFGECNIGTINEEVAKQFSPGDEFYLDFIKA